MNTYLAKRQAPAADLIPGEFHLAKCAPQSAVYVESKMRKKHLIIIKKAK
jgi:hypothetical protein